MKKITFIFMVCLAMNHSFGVSADILPIIDLEDFTFLDQYPHSFEEIGLVYSDLHFTEKRYDSYMKGGGQYFYAYRSDQISFYLYGNSRKDAQLIYLEIFSKKYENNRIKIIGSKREDIIRVLDESAFKSQLSKII